MGTVAKKSGKKVSSKKPAKKPVSSKKPVKKPAATKNDKRAPKKPIASKDVKKTSSKASSGSDFEMKYVPISKVKVIPNFNPRSKLGDISELKANVRCHGIIQALVVRPSAKNADVYELVAGNRRYAVAVELKLKTIPVIIRTDLADDAKALALAVSENGEEARTQLSTLDAAKAFKRIMDLSTKKLSPKEVGKMCGCSDQKVRLMLRLLEAPKSVKDKLSSGDIKSGAAVALTNMTPQVQKRVLDAIEPGMTEAEVRDLGNKVSKDIGVPATTTSKKGKLAGTPSGTLTLVRSRKEMHKKAEDLVIEILDEEDDGKDAKHLRYALAVLFWYFGTIEEIAIDSKEYKKEFAEIESTIEVIEE